MQVNFDPWAKFDFEGLVFLAIISEVACVASVFPFSACRGEETPAQMAMKKAFLSDKTSDLIPVCQSP